jgi:hypothetical protein
MEYVDLAFAPIETCDILLARAIGSIAHFTVIHLQAADLGTVGQPREINGTSLHQAPLSFPLTLQISEFASLAGITNSGW